MCRVFKLIIANIYFYLYDYIPKILLKIAFNVIYCDSNVQAASYFQEQLCILNYRLSTKQQECFLGVKEKYEIIVQELEQ